MFSPYTCCVDTQHCDHAFTYVHAGKGSLCGSQRTITALSLHLPSPPCVFCCVGQLDDPQASGDCLYLLSPRGNAVITDAHTASNPKQVLGIQTQFLVL